jgi:uncharacterized protein (DUF2141 family)
MRKVVQCLAGALLALSLAACSSDTPDPEPAPAPAPAKRDISGTVTVPAGGSIAGTELAACFIVNGQCDLDSSNSRVKVLQGSGASVTYTFENLVAGDYLLAAVQDTNASSALDVGDFVGFYTGSGSKPVAVRPPAQNIHITLGVYGGSTSSAGISGKVFAPSGGNVSGTRVVACFISGGACVSSHANTQQVTVSGSGTSGTFSFPSLAAGQYTLVATKDLNANSQLDTGDYEGRYTTGGTEASPVTSPAQSINIFLQVRGGGGNPSTPPAGVTFLRPADFTAGAATVTLTGLSSSERVAVIPVHASQSSTVDGLGFSINTTGVVAQSQEGTVAQSLVGDSDGSGAVEAPTAHQRAHLAWLGKGLRDVERLRHAGLRPLGASGRVRSQALDNCPAPYTVDTKACAFWVHTGNSQTRVTATLKHVSANAYWFVQNEDVGEFSSTELQGLANDFENRVIPPDRRYFGDFTDVDGNQKIIIVFSRLLGPQNLLGYVLPADLFDDGETFPAAGVHSNEGDIFYAATPSSLPGLSRSRYFGVVMPATMVHELKHLIATGRRILADNLPEELWIEEGSAMAAQQLAGLGTQVNEVQGYARFALAAPRNYRLVHEERPSGQEEGLSIYGYNFLLVWRAAQGKGHEAFWKDWAAGPGRGIANLEAHTGKPFTELMLDWATALALDHSHLLSGYDYDTFSLRDGSWMNLGYSTLQSGVSGTARSMAYFVGRGSGTNASINIRVTNGANPYAVVLRLPGALPWSPGTTSAIAPQPARGAVRTSAGSLLREALDTRAP